MDDGTTQEAMRIHYFSSRKASSESFTVTLVNGNDAWYGTIAADGNDERRRAISGSGNGPKLLELLRQLAEDGTGRAAESLMLADLAAYRQRREARE